jgi:hypothetical protein
VRASLTQADGPAARPLSEALSWRCHPARRRPVRAALVAGLHVVVGILLAQYTGSVSFAALLTLVLFLSLSAFFFPTSYRLTDQGVRVKTLVTTFERPWSTYRSYWPDRNGVLLSPFPGRSRLENFRGLFVRFDDNREAVVTFVKRFVAEPERDE